MWIAFARAIPIPASSLALWIPMQLVVSMQVVMSC
jgi:hypothetical protein